MLSTIRLAILLFAVFACTSAMAQPPKNTIQVEGKILDGEGNPLPGVNILVKGTTLGTVTDAEGYYKLTFPDKFGGHEVQASFIGYQPVAKPLTQAGIGAVKKLDFVMSTDTGSLHGWCCTDHKSPNGPHCGDTKEDLVKDFKCQTFKPDF
jgi:hypothetical protein